MALGVALLIAFGIAETKISDPMFRLSLFRIRAFAAGNLAGLLGSIARGGLQFMLIIWLQGIWLPLHGYDFADTPLWAGIYLVPLTVGFLVAGPMSGYLSDRFGQRPFATVGAAAVRGGVRRPAAAPGQLPVPGVRPADLPQRGRARGCSPSPNTSAIMSSVPASHRGAASGMRATFQNSGTSLSIGIFFSLMVAGLAAELPRTLAAGLRAPGRARRGRRARLAPAAGQHAVRGVPRLQPDQEPARPGRPGQAARPQRRRC